MCNLSNPNLHSFKPFTISWTHNQRHKKKTHSQKKLKKINKKSNKQNSFPEHPQLFEEHPLNHIICSLHYFWNTLQEIIYISIGHYANSLPARQINSENCLLCTERRTYTLQKPIYQEGSPSQQDTLHVKWLFRINGGGKIVARNRSCWLPQSLRFYFIDLGMK